MSTVTPGRLLLLLLAIVCCNLPLYAQANNYANNNSGREFWIAIPPNEADHAYPSLELEIYVSSLFNTDVVIEHPGSGFRIMKKVRAGQTTTFTTADQTAQWSWEIREDERPSNQGIRITSKKPITVSVLNAKNVTSEGYTALPVDAWGTDYMHMSFYDFGEYAAAFPWGGGFVIVAKEDNTKVMFTLNGVDKGNPSARTKMGKRIGDTYTVTLRRGQTYMVRGNGQTLNEFDFSGTRIQSSKPIGVFSFHQRTMIPSFPSPNNGRDYLVEMMTPIASWGIEHVSVELQRGSGLGDLFRIVAAEDNTKFTCRYTELKTGNTYSWEGVLKKAGDFMEKENSWPPSTSIEGTAVWTSDKPTLVMQYAYSAAWDDQSQWDPMMIRVVPTAQFAKQAIIQTPANVEFINNYINIVAIGDTNDGKLEMLKSITVDGVPLFTMVPQFLKNRIQNTNYHWAQIKVAPGAHVVKGNALFSACIYGTASLVAYGWTAAELYNKLDILDTLAPVMEVANSSCGEYTVMIKETRDSGGQGDSAQVDSGISRIELDYELSTNMTISYVTDSSTIHVEPRREQFIAKLNVADPTKPAIGVVYAIDRAGNVVVDTMRYSPEVAVMEPALLSMGEVRVGRSSTATITLRNPLSGEITINQLHLRRGVSFSLNSTTVFPATLPPNSLIQVEVNYHPQPPPTFLKGEVDTIEAEMACGVMMLGRVQGISTISSVMLSGHNFGAQMIGGTSARTDFRVQNTGSYPVTISTITVTNSAFYIDGPTPALPFVLLPGEEVKFQSVCFAPQVDSAYSGYLVVHWRDESTGGVDTSQVYGIGFTPTSIVLPGESILALEILPNPTSDRFTLSYTLPLEGAIRAELFTATGHMVRLLRDRWNDAGNHAIDVPVVDLPAGVYFCRITTPIGVLVRTITLVK